jgi:hypothetical protein
MRSISSAPCDAQVQRQPALDQWGQQSQERNGFARRHRVDDGLDRGSVLRVRIRRDHHDDVQYSERVRMQHCQLPVLRRLPSSHRQEQMTAAKEGIALPGALIHAPALREQIAQTRCRRTAQGHCRSHFPPSLLRSTYQGERGMQQQRQVVFRQRIQQRRPA